MVGNYYLVKFVGAAGYRNCGAGEVMHYKDSLGGRFHIPRSNGVVAGGRCLDLTFGKGRMGVAGIGKVAVELKEGAVIGGLGLYGSLTPQ